MVLNLREFTQREVNVFRTDANPRNPVELECLWTDRYELLLLVRCSHHAIPGDARTEEHDRTDGPMVFTIPIVIGGCTPHLALNDHHQLVANL